MIKFPPFCFKAYSLDYPKTLNGKLYDRELDWLIMINEITYLVYTPFI